MEFDVVSSGLPAARERSMTMTKESNKQAKPMRVSILKKIEYEGTVKVRKRLTEVGVDGMFIDTYVTLPVGSTIKLRLWLMNSDQPLEVAAEVMRVERGIGMEVKFLDLKPEARASLENLIES